MYSPLTYAETSILAKEAAAEMLSRLDWMSINPKIIVDMGCGPGEMSAQLQRRYKEAKVLALDISESMLQYAKQQYPTLNDTAYLCAEASQLPFQDQVVDLIFANFLLPWCADMTLLLREWRRVLRPNGLILFTALGLDTLQESYQLFNSNDVPNLIDMHDIGDLLLQEKFADPVLDVNHYTLIYHDKEKLISELYQSGIVTQSARTADLNALVPLANGTWPVTYEIIYAHAFLPEVQEEISASADGMVRIPLSHLRKRLPSNSEGI